MPESPSVPWYQHPLVLKLTGSFVRSAFKGLGGVLVAKQVITTDDATQYLNAVTDPVFLLGVFSFVVPSILSMFGEILNRKKLLVAIDKAPDKPTEELITAIAKDQVVGQSAPKAMEIR